MTAAQKEPVLPTPTGCKLPPPTNPDAPAEMPPENVPSRYDGVFRKEGETFRLLSADEMSASNGSPPQVYEVVWNPHRAEVIEDPYGRRPGLHGTTMNTEFVTYGVKHVKFWYMHASGDRVFEWNSENGIFKPENVQNVVSASLMNSPPLSVSMPRSRNGRRL